ncbi:AcrR family transcriptional regulator [Nocardioides thalensis]|uniref:AcrR family transcriptional regulator n=1 Tax=Nocardioides thalensis TaxID=1914755 RepID=A0A853C1I8_9ACTN|nr:TetR family transcriptional regulator [Nocardioides thalensis]NYJ00856.1 AcrR family transcriptional regulator [Nocardioides thalensis]
MGSTRRPSRARAFVALRELLIEQPWGEVTLEAVAKRAGVSRQTLYNDFGSRNGLAIAYTESMVDTYLDLVDEAMAAAPDPATGIESMVRLLLDATASDPLVQRVQTGNAHHDLVRIVTSDSGPLLDRIAGRLRDGLLRRWPEIDPQRAEAGAVVMARFGLGLVTMPPPAGADLAPGIAAVLAPGLRPGNVDSAV